MFICKESNGFYYLYYTDEITGKRKKISTRTRIKYKANLFFKLFEPPRKVVVEEPEVFRLEQLEPIIMDYVLNNLGIKAIYHYQTTFKHLKEIIGNKPIKEIKFNDIELYKSVRVQSVSKTTVNIELRNMKAAFNIAIKSELLDKNPLRYIKPYSVPQKERLCFSNEDIQKILKVITNPQIKNITIFALLTGCRLGEILNVQWKDIDLEQKILTIRNKPNFKTKSGKIRQIPISDSLFELLSSLLGNTNENVFELNNPESYLFNIEGKRYNQEYITRTFKKFLRKAGMHENLHFHCTRHTFLSQLASQGVSIYHLKEIAGHSDIKTTQIYLHTVTNDLRYAMNKMKLSI